ncbi:uncharacterized protein [Rutidosis leptorrhynchoides]|uniref:uncharacterized protein n=1 Tax=Rutidosis leptorrhynchoides TaxID=125765 RepID=UPI003A991EF2
MRDVLRGRFIHDIGDGTITSAWFDEWNEVGPLINIVRRRDIVNGGMLLTDQVCDIVDQAMWRWPPDWVDRYAILNNLAPPVLSVNSDMVMWKDIASNKCVFSISHVWEFLRPHAPTVQWYAMVWFSQCIPRHTFVVSLLMGERLKTQDRLKAWEIHHGSSLLCPLCNMVQDSHDHLFFSCLFSSQFAVRNVARIVVIKLLFAASVYYVWQERNRRLFKKGNRSAVQLYETIYSTVRLKLMSFRWKSTPSALRLKSDWKIS